MARSASPAAPRSPVNIALFDSSTLVGKGVKTHLANRRFPVGKVRLFDTGAVEDGGNVTEFRGEPLLAVRPDPQEMEKVDLAFFCGHVGTGKEFLGWAGRGRFVAIDLTLSANARANVPVVNTSVNPEAARRHEGILASPHPVSQILSTLMAPLSRRFTLEDAVSIILQPVSEAGEQGIEELYRQTVGLLNFNEVPKDLFGRVLAFNLMPASLGSEGGITEDQVACEVGSILGKKDLPVAVKILLAPVFHCHSVVTRMRFTGKVSPEGIREALAEEPSIRVRNGAGGATPAELAGEEKIVVAEIRPDPAIPGSFWLWGVSDNLATGSALNAVRIAEVLVSSGSLSGRDRS